MAYGWKRSALGYSLPASPPSVGLHNVDVEPLRRTQNVKDTNETS
jgi:hypothetical protein